MFTFSRAPEPIRVQKASARNFQKNRRSASDWVSQFVVVFSQLFCSVVSFVCLLSERRKKNSVKNRFRSRSDSKVSLSDKMAKLIDYKLPIINIQLIYFYIISASTKKRECFRARRILWCFFQQWNCVHMRNRPRITWIDLKDFMDHHGLHWCISRS